MGFNGGMAMTPSDREYSVSMTPEQWHERLSPQEFAVLREAGTERTFTGEYTDRSQNKFDSHCGWPSFYSPLAEDRVEYIEDRSLPGRPRVEVRCASCGSHLGHVFEGEGYDTPTDLRYCINSISLTLRPE